MKTKYFNITYGKYSPIFDRLDNIFRKVKDVLNMRPRLKKRINILVYEDMRELQRETKVKFISFYIYKLDTIYTNDRDIKKTIVHEFAHAITDHFFIKRPPENIRELIAKYAEREYRKKN